jgi:hypothetical protein
MAWRRGTVDRQGGKLAPYFFQRRARFTNKGSQPVFGRECLRCHRGLQSPPKVEHGRETLI